MTAVADSFFGEPITSDEEELLTLLSWVMKRATKREKRHRLDRVRSVK
jgi:hypothetical protein